LPCTCSSRHGDERRWRGWTAPRSGSCWTNPTATHALTEFQRDGRLEGHTSHAVQRALDCLTRDEQLRTASGRWVPGHPDPDQFVPGDVAAVRVGAGKAILISSWRTDPHGNRLRVRFERSDLLQQQLKALDLPDLTAAVPYFIPTAAALGVLASRPPDPQLLEELRLPFERVFVLFGADLELDPIVYRWPADYPWRQLPRHSITYQLLQRGGYVSGMVLLADQHARLRDDLLWLVAANPDPTLPWPANLDRIRGVVRGWRSAAQLVPLVSNIAAQLAPLVTNVAAAVAWGAWQPPTTLLPLPTDPSSRQWRKAVKRGVFRRREPRGDAIGVHVLDLERTTTHQTSTAPDPNTAAARTSPIPHLRRGHFRRVRIGARGDWHYQIRWIAPTLVRGDQPANERLVVRRLPPPPLRQRQAQDDAGEGMLARQDLPKTNPPPVHSRVLDADLVGDRVNRQLPQGPDDPTPSPFHDPGPARTCRTATVKTRPSMPTIDLCCR
jgi:hypothetical protein